MPMVPLERIQGMPVSQLPPGGSVQRGPTGLAVVGVLRVISKTALLLLALGVVAIPAYIALSRLGYFRPAATQTTPVPTYVPTATLASGFAGFANSQYSLAFPVGWNTSSGSVSISGGARLATQSFSSSDGIQVVVAAGTAFPEDQLASRLDEVARALITHSELQATTTNVRVTYSGATWLENDYTATIIGSNSTLSVRLRVLALDAGATSYFVYALAPVANFPQANSADFTIMLNSFRSR